MSKGQVIMSKGQRRAAAYRGLLFVLIQRLREGDRLATDQINRGWAKDKPLDPRNAVTITVRELYALADRLLEPELTPEANEEIGVARIPTNVAEARAMLAMSMLADEQMYGGYTAAELAVLPGGAQVNWSDPNLH
jgi:hypothetical protein